MEDFLLAVVGILVPLLAATAAWCRQLMRRVDELQDERTERLDARARENEQTAARLARLQRKWLDHSARVEKERKAARRALQQTTTTMGDVRRVLDHLNKSLVN